MASKSKRSRSDTQIYTPHGHKSSAMSNATCWDYSSNHGLDFADCQGPSRSFNSRQTAQEISSFGLQQSTPFSGLLTLSPSPYVTPDELFNKIESPFESILTSQDYTASSSTGNGRRTGPEDYPMQAWQYPYMAENQNWKQNLDYPGHQQYSEGSYQHSSQPMQPGSYPTSSENTRHPQKYNPDYVPPSYMYNNRMTSIASPGSSAYPSSMMAVDRPRIVVDKAQDDPICSPMDDQSSIYQDCLGTNIASVSRRGVFMGLNAQRPSTRTRSRSLRTHNDMIDTSDFEESAAGKLSVPRTPRRGQREDVSQRRRRHLTPEGREHANEVRKVHACTDCRRRKIKVGLIWNSGFARLLTPRESSANMY